MHRPGASGRGVRDRPGHLLAASSRASRSASRATSAASRSASRSSAARSSPRGSWTRPRPPARRATASPPRRSISSSATPSPTPPRARCSRWRRRRGAPVVLLGLQPTPTLDYANTDTGEWLANCAACCVPEIAGAFTRARIPYDTVAGTIDDDERAWAKIGAWVRAAGVARALRRSRIGFLGHTYPGMLDLYTDFTAVHAQVGRARRGARDRRPRRAGRAGDRRGGDAAKLDEIRAMFAFADPSDGPDRRADRGRAARLVGARRSRPRPARRPTSSSTR